MTIAYFTEFEFQSAPGLSHLQTILIEPLLIVAAVGFWFVTLPFVAVSVVCAKTWHRLVAIKPASAAPANPLFLRRSSLAQNKPTIPSRPVRTRHV